MRYFHLSQLTSYNDVARKMHLNLGFAVTGEVIDNETVVRMAI